MPAGSSAAVGAASGPARPTEAPAMAAADEGGERQDHGPRPGDAGAEQRDARAAGRGQVAEDAGLDVLGAGGRADDGARDEVSSMTTFMASSKLAAPPAGPYLPGCRRAGWR